MTIQERAEKIMDFIHAIADNGAMNRNMVGNFIESELNDAVKAAVEEQRKNTTIALLAGAESMNEARNEAYEKAAQVCDRLASRALSESRETIEGARFLATEIRALKERSD